MASRDTKMLQMILNGQSKTQKQIKDLGKSVKNEFEKVHKRIDALGGSLAYLEDDAPTIEDHESLEKRVTKLEKKYSTV